MKLQSEFSREFLKTIFARLPPLASAARCGPHPPRYASTVYEILTHDDDDENVLCSAVVNVGIPAELSKHCCKK